MMEMHLGQSSNVCKEIGLDTAYLLFPSEGFCQIRYLFYYFQRFLSPWNNSLLRSTTCMQSDIKKVKFKPGLPLEVEIIPIADTVIKHHDTITNPHRPEFYHIFWIQKGTPEYLVDFKKVIIQANSFLFVNKDRVQALDHTSRHDGKLLLFTDSFFCAE